MRLLLASLLSACLVLAGATAASAAPTGGRTEYTLRGLYVDGRGSSTTTVVGNGAAVRLIPTFRWRYRGSTSRPRIGLQWYRDGAWRDTAARSVTVPKDLVHDDLVVWTRPYSTGSATEKVRYRLVSQPYSDASGIVDNRSTSRAFTVTYENQGRYTGLRAEAWQTVRGACPTTAVRIGGVRRSDAAGLFSTGTQLIRLDASVGGYPAADRATVALHECAHERQWLNYGSTSAGWSRMERAAKRIYVDDAAPDGSSKPSVKPFDAVEHGADCAAKAVDPDGYLGYRGWCDPKELAAGRRLLEGHRY